MLPYKNVGGVVCAQIIGGSHPPSHLSFLRDLVKPPMGLGWLAWGLLGGGVWFHVGWEWALGLGLGALGRGRGREGEGEGERALVRGGGCREP